MVFWGMVWLCPPPQIRTPRSSDLFILSLSSVKPRLLLNKCCLLFRQKEAVDSPKQSPALRCTAWACPCRDHCPPSLPPPSSAAVGGMVDSCPATVPGAPNAERPHTRLVAQWPHAHTTTRPHPPTIEFLQEPPVDRFLFRALICCYSI